jgi:hypothetical protein
VFFAHDSPGYVPFAIRFGGPDSFGNLAYHVRVGLAIEEWEKGIFSEILEEDDKILDENSPISLSEDNFLFIRIRKSPPQSLASDCVSISIGPRHSWNINYRPRAQALPGAISTSMDQSEIEGERLFPTMNGLAIQHE